MRFINLYIKFNTNSKFFQFSSKPKKNASIFIFNVKVFIEEKIHEDSKVRNKSLKKLVKIMKKHIFKIVVKWYFCCENISNLNQLVSNDQLSYFSIKYRIMRRISLIKPVYF
jgi:hypothetical protein